jgi:PPOX class probable F420-dependent enzyme
VRLPAHAVAAILDRWPVARLATLGPDGRPALVPIVFVRAAERIWSPVDAKPKSGRELERLRNVRRDPRVALLLDHYGPDWEQLWWLRLEGRARACSRDELDAAALERALRAKYPQYAQLPVFAGEPAALEIRIERTLGWCASERALRSCT